MIFGLSQWLPDTWWHALRIRVRRRVRCRHGARHRRKVGRMRRPPVSFQVLGHVFACLLQLVLVQDDIEHLRRTLRQLFRGHHLYVEVTYLRLSSGLDQPLQDLRRRDLQINNRGRQAGLRQLRRVVYGVAIQHDQLELRISARLIYSTHVNLRFRYSQRIRLRHKINI